MENDKILESLICEWEEQQFSAALRADPVSHGRAQALRQCAQQLREALTPNDESTEGE